MGVIDLAPGNSLSSIRKLDRAHWVSLAEGAADRIP